MTSWFSVVIWTAIAGLKPLPFALRVPSPTKLPEEKPPVGSQECDALRMLEICSHTGHGVEECQPPNGLLKDMQIMWKGDVTANRPPVRCFDLDLMETADGEFLVGYSHDWPQKLQDSILTFTSGNSTIFDAIRSLTVDKLRGSSIGLSAEKNPTLSSVLSLLNDTVNSETEQKKQKGLLAFQLKTQIDEERLKALLDYIANATQKDERITAMLAIWHMPEHATELRQVQMAHSPSIQSIYGLPDRPHEGYAGASNYNLETAKATNFTLAGPSIKLSNQFLTSIQNKYDLDSFAWVIDTKEEFRKAAQSKLHYLVSNHPWNLNLIRDQLLQHCDKKNG